VRCECRRLKEKWACHKVQAALVAGGGSRDYDGTVSQRLLQCDAECKAAAAAKAKAQPAATNAAAAAAVASKAAPEPAPTAAAAAAKEAAASKPSTKKMSRAEREALQAARVAEQLKAEMWARRKRQAKQYGGPLLVVLVLALVTLGVFRAMEVLDRRARQVWAPDAGAFGMEL
jgi:cobalamin biosynthesis Mg chelatase CobN